MKRQLTKNDIGRKNLNSLSIFNATSHLWFDGGLWLIYFQHQGVTLFQVGILEAILHIVAVASDLPIGVFADRFGWKLSLSLGSLLGVGYTSIALFGHGFWWFAVAFACRGLQVTFTNGSDSSLAYESAVWAGMKEQYLKISGRMFAISLVSLGVAEGAGGALAHFSWASIYIAFTVANLTSFVVLQTLREPRHDHVADVREHSSITKIAADAYQFARKSPVFLWWILLSATISGFVASFSFYGQSMLIHAGWSLIGIGILTGTENGLGALAASLSDRASRRVGQIHLFLWASVLVSAGLLLFAWLPGLVAASGYILASVAGAFFEPMIDQGLNQVIPTGQRATLLSVNSTAFSLFMIVGFPMFGALAEHFGLAPAAKLASIVGCIVILATTLLWRALVTNNRSNEVQRDPAS